MQNSNFLGLSHVCIINFGFMHIASLYSEKNFWKFFLKKHFGKYCGKDQWGRIETSKPLEANRKDINKGKN